ncbi:MAG: hypothetical protein ACQXXG_09450 [Candidatus Bathyarchaeia archaeon]|jgi:hypothetical protein
MSSKSSAVISFPEVLDERLLLNYIMLKDLFLAFLEEERYDYKLSNNDVRLDSANAELTWNEFLKTFFEEKFETTLEVFLRTVYLKKGMGAGELAITVTNENDAVCTLALLLLSDGFVTSSEAERIIQKISKDHLRKKVSKTLGLFNSCLERKGLFQATRAVKNKRLRFAEYIVERLNNNIFDKFAPPLKGVELQVPVAGDRAETSFRICENCHSIVEANKCQRCGTKASKKIVCYYCGAVVDESEALDATKVIGTKTDYRTQTDVPSGKLHVKICKLCSSSWKFSPIYPSFALLVLERIDSRFSWQAFIDLSEKEVFGVGRLKLIRVTEWTEKTFLYEKAKQYYPYWKLSSYLSNQPFEKRKVMENEYISGEWYLHTPDGKEKFDGKIAVLLAQLHLPFPVREKRNAIWEIIDLALSNRPFHAYYIYTKNISKHNYNYIHESYINTLLEICEMEKREEYDLCLGLAGLLEAFLGKMDKPTKIAYDLDFTTSFEYELVKNAGDTSRFYYRDKNAASYKCLAEYMKKLGIDFDKREKMENNRNYVEIHIDDVRRAFQHVLSLVDAKKLNGERFKEGVMYELLSRFPAEIRRERR